MASLRGLKGPSLKRTCMGVPSVEKGSQLEIIEGCVRASLSEPVPAPDLTESIMLRLPITAGRPRSWFSWGWASACAAAAILGSSRGRHLAAPCQIAGPRQGRSQRSGSGQNARFAPAREQNNP